MSMYMLSKTWQRAALCSRSCQSLDVAQGDRWPSSTWRGSRGLVFSLPSTTLFNLGDVELEKAVEPLNKLLSAELWISQSTLWELMASVAYSPRLAHCDRKKRKERVGSLIFGFEQHKQVIQRVDSLSGDTTKMGRIRRELM